MMPAAGMSAPYMPWAARGAEFEEGAGRVEQGADAVAGEKFASGEVTLAGAGAAAFLDAGEGGTEGGDEGGHVGGVCAEGVGAFVREGLDDRHAAPPFVMGRRLHEVAGGAP